MGLLIVGGMLALSISASLTPANTASGFPKFMCNGADICHPGPNHCIGKCETELWNTRKVKN
jgi:hypothetical protein